jgi:hypothetical protein
MGRPASVTLIAVTLVSLILLLRLRRRGGLAVSA